MSARTIEYQAIIANQLTGFLSTFRVTLTLKVTVKVTNKDRVAVMVTVTVRFRVFIDK